MSLGDTIKAKRESRGMTQQDLADMLHVTRQTVSRWESGSRCPDIIMSKQIADAFEMTLDDLVSEKDVAEYIPPRNSASRVEKMLASIFLLVLGVWFLVYAFVSNETLFAVIAMILPFAASFLFIVSYFQDAEKSNG